MRCVALLAGTLLGGLAVTHAEAQANAIIQRDKTSSSLSGTVYIGGEKVSGGYDPDQRLDEVAIALCESTFHRCKTVAKTDAEGHFDLKKKVRQGQIYYLRFLRLNICEDRLTVTIQRGAPAIEFSMVMGF